jgi:sugar lactone lactonase YvrE
MLARSGRRTMGLAAIACLLLVTAVSPPEAGAAELQGRVLSGARPVASAPLVLHRAAPGAGRPATLARARTARDGSFRLHFRARARRGAAVYVTVGWPSAGPSASRNGAGGGATRLAAVLAARIPRRVVVNERTTVAAGYALAQFIRSGRIAGSSPGLGNAASMAANLADARTGRVARVLSSRPNGRQTSTRRTFNSLANMLVRCVRRERECAKLFRLATPPRGRPPRGTLEAVADIARNPAHNVGRLFKLTRTGPYRPALRSSRRLDAWTLALRFDGDGKSLSGPGNFGIDAQGNIWVINNYEYSPRPLEPTCSSDLLFKFTPDGRFAPGSPYEGGGLSGAGFGITFDPSGDLWVGNFGFAAPGCASPPPHNSVSKFSHRGRALSPGATDTFGGGFTEGSLSWPQGTVSDRAGNIWIANCGNDSVTVYPHGDPSVARNLIGLGVQKPFDIAFNGRGQAFVSGNSSDTVAMLNPDGSPTTRSPISGGGLNRPLGLAVDSRGNMWVANSGVISVPCPSVERPTSPGGSLTLIGPDGRLGNPTAFTGGGLTVPWGIAVDGDDNVWIANFERKRVSEFCGTRPGTCPPGVGTGEAISPDGSGYGFDGLTRNTGVAIDPSGNVWLTNNWKDIPVQANPGGHQIVAFVGLAAPLKTPLIGPPRRR